MQDYTETKDGFSKTSQKMFSLVQCDQLVSGQEFQNLEFSVIFFVSAPTQLLKILDLCCEYENCSNLQITLDISMSHVQFLKQLSTSIWFFTMTAILSCSYTILEWELGSQK